MEHLRNFSKSMLLLYDVDFSAILHHFGDSLPPALIIRKRETNLLRCRRHMILKLN